VFHVQLRQFPHVTRSFNLSQEELESRVLRPWLAGVPVELGDRRWAPDRARLVVYEGPAVASEEMGLGRGWANATRVGTDVTALILANAQSSASAPIAELKAAILEHVTDRPIALAQLVELACERHPQARVSEGIALAEQAAWELLHEGRVRIVAANVALARERWRPTLLSWAAWTDPAVLLETQGQTSRSV
jgi:hypothetical protein